MQETWPDLFRRGLKLGPPESHWHLGLGGATAPEIVGAFRGSAAYLHESGVRVVVAQFGIVDSTPRPLPARLRSLLIKLGFSKTERRLRRSRLAYHLWGRPWTTVSRYNDAAQELVSLCEAIGAELIFVAIFSPGPELVDIVGAFDVTRYNRVLEAMASGSLHVHLLRPPADLLSDGHHLSKAGHRLVARDLLQACGPLLEVKRSADETGGGGRAAEASEK